MLTELPYISEIAKSQGELAKERSKDSKEGDDTKAFWYWLGYHTGIATALNPDGEKSKCRCKEHNDHWKCVRNCAC